MQNPKFENFRLEDYQSYLRILKNPTKENDRIIVSLLKERKYEEIDRLLEICSQTQEITRQRRDKVFLMAITFAEERISRMVIENLGVNYYLEDKYTLLTSAVRLGNTTFVNCIRKTPGIDLNLRSKDKQSNALVFAINAGDLFMTYKLIQEGVNFMELDYVKNSVLHHLCLKNPNNAVSLIKNLITEYPQLNLNLPNDWNVTPLHFICLGGHYNLLVELYNYCKFNEQTLKFLARSDKGHTMLHYACSSFISRKYRDLIRVKGARDKIASNVIRIIDFLLKEPLNLNSQSNEGDTCGHILALVCPEPKVMIHLIKKGLNPRIKRQDNLDCYDYALKNKNYAIAAAVKYYLSDCDMENVDYSKIEQIESDLVEAQENVSQSEIVCAEALTDLREIDRMSDS